MSPRDSEQPLIIVQETNQESTAFQFTPRAFLGYANIFLSFSSSGEHSCVISDVLANV